MKNKNSLFLPLKISALMIFTALVLILFSCTDYFTQGNHEIHSTAQALFLDDSSDKEMLTFDDIVKNISGSNMSLKLIQESRTDAKISDENGVFYTVTSESEHDFIKIFPVDTFIEILSECGYIETESLDEPTLYTFIFNALDEKGEKNEFTVYVTRSCVKFDYNGISNGKEYANMFSETAIYSNYKNVSYAYDFFAEGIIPDENGQRATIW